MKLFHVTNNRNMDNDPLKHYITIFMRVRVRVRVRVRIRLKVRVRVGVSIRVKEGRS
jgi:hypothetical protein